MQRIARWLATPIDPVWAAAFLSTLVIMSLWTIERNTTALVVLVRDLRARGVADSMSRGDHETLA